MAAQYADIIFPLKTGGCLYFADEDALKGTLPSYIKEVKPTLFMAVPRVWEKITESIQKAFESKPRIYSWTSSIGKKGTDAEMKGESTSIAFKLLKKTVIAKLKKQIGFDECQHLIFGAAP